MRKTSGTPFVRLILLAGALASQLAAQGDRGVITGTGDFTVPGER
jgi:hypothetical protein